MSNSVFLIFEIEDGGYECGDIHVLRSVRPTIAAARTWPPKSRIEDFYVQEWRPGDDKPLKTYEYKKSEVTLEPKDEKEN